MSRSRNFVVVMSINFFSPSLGSIEATVRSPRGGRTAFFEMNFNAFLKLQKVSGTSGLTRSILIIMLPILNTCHESKWVIRGGCCDISNLACGEQRDQTLKRIDQGISKFHWP